jgi:hypothetical protein
MASSCSDIFAPSGGDTPREGKALVKLAINYSPALDALVNAPALNAFAGAKSLMPGSPTFSHFDLEFTSLDGFTSVSRSNAASTDTVELDPGRWGVSVIAKRSASGEPGAKGSSGYVTLVSGAPETLQVTLDVYDYSEAGNGDFSYYVSSDLAGTVDITLRPLKGGADILVVQNLAIGMGGSIAGVTGIPVGDYDLFVKVTSGGKTAGMYSAAQIYRGLETGTGDSTSSPFKFDSGDFRDYVWLEGTFTVNMPPGRSLYSGTNLEVGFYSDSARTIPLVSAVSSSFTMSGLTQTCTCTWQGKVPYTQNMPV